MHGIKLTLTQENREFSVWSGGKIFPKWYEQTIDVFSMLFGSWRRELPDVVRKCLKSVLIADSALETEEGVRYEFDFEFMPEMFDEGADWGEERFAFVFEGFVEGVIDGLEAIAEDPECSDAARGEAKRLLDECDKWAENEISQ